MKRTLTEYGGFSTNKRPKYSVQLIIYGYKQEEKWVYVGQTRQSLPVRDKQHLHSSETKFDQAYNDARTFTGPIVLEQTYRSSIMEEQAATLALCQEWLNEREVHWINEHQTYTQGLNQTTGGQFGLDEAYYEAQIKKRNADWNDVKMPLLRISEYGKKGRLWKIPCNTPIIGTLLTHMRKRNNIPPQHLPELNLLGYKDGKTRSESKWDIDYMPLFRASEYAKKGRLWEIPYETPILGNLLDCMRSGQTIPSYYLAELNRFGYNDGKSYYESKWDVDYMPLFRDSEYGKKGRLWEITQKTPILGTLLNGMRSGNSIPPQYLPELNRLGYNDGKSFYESKWDIDYMPLFRVSEFAERGRLWELPYEIPILGNLLDHMRSGQTIPSYYLAELNRFGYNDGKSYYESKWDVDYMPLFRDSEFAKKGRLWKIPCKTHILGTLLNGMRSGTSIPPQYLPELNRLGYNDGKSFYESKWDIDYMPLFRNSEFAKKGRLWEIPQKTPILGNLLTRMRNGNNSIPPQYLPELSRFGYNDGKSSYELKWDIDYMPLLRASEFAKKGHLRDMPTKYPVVGKVMLSFRSKPKYRERLRTTIPGIYKELLELGAYK